MRYNPGKIESKWQKTWLVKRIYEPNLRRAKKPFYNLTMFPYPSADGLHVGNMYDMVGCDIFGRFKHMQGHDVFQPIGLDGFGIHSENYALKVNKHPMLLSKITEKRFYGQIQKVGAGFAWNERLETYDPEYYQWTQWIFIQMFKRGLAYRKKAPVNWCPSCKTVLADEQVVAGDCERCGTEVAKKELEQWFLRITDYAERLLQNLQKIDWSENVKVAQRNWISKSEGTLLRFNVKCQMPNVRCPSIEVFTTRPDTIFGATYMAVAPDHPLVSSLITKERKEIVASYLKGVRQKSGAGLAEVGKVKTGVFTGSFAINPADSEAIPIWIADYVLSTVGTGAIMAVPAHDQRDFEFAKKFNLPIKIVVCPHYPKITCPTPQRAHEGEGHLVGSGRFDGMPSQQARSEIARWLGGKVKAQYRLRDWLISRQRYWGPPIPLIFCATCKKLAESSRFQVPSPKFSRGELENPGWVAVPEKDLPVILPYIKNFRPTGTEKSPLASYEKFYKVRCPRCGGEALRETDVSDTFLDSAWYYYRYVDIKNKKDIFSKTLVRKWLPVARYMGGFEHAVLHLLYTRFITMVFYDWGLIDFDEPFKVFRAHGHITKDGAKMSKSKGNVVVPDEYIRLYGADALRMYLMFLGPFEHGGDFREEGTRGITRFLGRVWRFAQNFAAQNSKYKMQNTKLQSKARIDLQRTVQRTIRKVTEDIEGLQYNTAISALMTLLNESETNYDAVTGADIKIFLKLLAPFAPYITEELYQQLFGNPKSAIRNPKQTQNSKSQNQETKFQSVHLESWPQYDSKLIEDKTFELVVQVNGKVRSTIELARGISEKDARDAALANEAVKKYVIGPPKKIIFVKDRLINFVL